jgi:hypothetical protein
MALAAKFAREVRELKLQIRHHDSLLSLHAKVAYSMQAASSSSSSSSSSNNSSSSSAQQCSSAALNTKSALRLTDNTASEVIAVTHVLDTKLLAGLYSVLEDDDGDVLLQKLQMGTHTNSAVHELTCNGTCDKVHYKC